jgi:DNA helicase IV
MEDFLEILKYVLPSLVVFAATYFVIQKFLDNEHRKQLLLLRRENQKITTPLRLQAYERLILFLERIALNNLVLRIHQQGMTSKSLQKELIKSVNQEFDHNLIQQIYISSTSWGHIKKTKDDVIKIINLSATHLPANAPAADLGQKIFDIMLKTKATPTNDTIALLKKEIRQLF